MLCSRSLRGLGVRNDAASVLAVYSTRVGAAKFRGYFGQELSASAQGYPTRDQVLRRGARRKNSLGRLLLFDDSASDSSRRLPACGTAHPARSEPLDNKR